LSASAAGQLASSERQLCYPQRPHGAQRRRTGGIHPQPTVRARRPTAGLQRIQ